jgi:hypothetical protein
MWGPCRRRPKRPPRSVRRSACLGEDDHPSHRAVVNHRDRRRCRQGAGELRVIGNAGARRTGVGDLGFAMSAHASCRTRIRPIVAGGANATSGGCNHRSGHAGVDARTAGLGVERQRWHGARQCRLSEPATYHAGGVHALARSLADTTRAALASRSVSTASAWGLAGVSAQSRRSRPASTDGSPAITSVSPIARSSSAYSVPVQSRTLPCDSSRAQRAIAWPWRGRSIKDASTK